MLLHDRRWEQEQQQQQQQQREQQTPTTDGYRMAIQLSGTPDSRTPENTGALVSNVMISLIGVTILTAFISRRQGAVETWSKLPCIKWLTIGIYAYSYVFILIGSLLHFGLQWNESHGLCQISTYLCILAYILAKVFICMFMVERVHLVLYRDRKRRHSKLFICNFLGVIAIYAALITYFFKSTTDVIDSGICIAGLDRPWLYTFIIMDTVINLYLTTLFLIPLFQSHSFRIRPPFTTDLLGVVSIERNVSARLRRLATRSFAAAILILVGVVGNLTTMAIFDGEPIWLCLLTCKSDLLFTCCIIHWVTSCDGESSRKVSSANGSGGSGGMTSLIFASKPRAAHEAVVTPAAT